MKGPGFWPEAGLACVLNHAVELLDGGGLQSVQSANRCGFPARPAIDAIKSGLGSEASEEVEALLRVHIEMAECLIEEVAGGGEGLAADGTTVILS
ncbi:hypothetical protein C0V97_09130 [Asaia sp. W19]|nr:hypothetical protein C0V97_09130 [Asaia sp. W19]